MSIILPRAPWIHADLEELTQEFYNRMYHAVIQPRRLKGSMSHKDDIVGTQICYEVLSLDKIDYLRPRVRRRVNEVGNRDIHDFVSTIGGMISSIDGKTISNVSLEVRIGVNLDDKLTEKEVKVKGYDIPTEQKHDEYLQEAVEKFRKEKKKKLQEQGLLYRGGPEDLHVTVEPLYSLNVVTFEHPEGPPTKLIFRKKIYGSRWGGKASKYLLEHLIDCTAEHQVPLEMFNDTVAATLICSPEELEHYDNATLNRFSSNYTITLDHKPGPAMGIPYRRQSQLLEGRPWLPEYSVNEWDPKKFATYVKEQIQFERRGHKNLKHIAEDDIKNVPKDEPGREELIYEAMAMRIHNGFDTSCYTGPNWGLKYDMFLKPEKADTAAVDWEFRIGTPETAEMDAIGPLNRNVFRKLRALRKIDDRRAVGLMQTFTCVELFFNSLVAHPATYKDVRSQLENAYISHAT